MKEAEKIIWDSWHQERQILIEKKKEIAKAAGSLETRDYCIVRCIERGKEGRWSKIPWRIPATTRPKKQMLIILIVALGETKKDRKVLEAGKILIFSPFIMDETLKSHLLMAQVPHQQLWISVSNTTYKR